jgi:peroxiredoxin-like protein
MEHETHEGDEQMMDLSFDVELRWSQDGRKGRGEIDAHDLALEISGPESMGGLGVGTNPEELLVCAVSSCYTATLFAVLRRARLPVDSLAVSASGGVTGFPRDARFAYITVSPTVWGGDVARQPEYEEAAVVARDRCFIGGTLAPEVDYGVGSVEVRREVALAAVASRELLALEGKRSAPEDAGERLPAWRAA